MIEKIKSLWAQADKKTVKIFGMYSFALWVFMVVIFYGIAKWTEPEVEDFDVSLLDPVDGELAPLSSSSEPENNFQENEFSKTPRTISKNEDKLAHKKLAEIYFQQGDMGLASKHFNRVSSSFSGDLDFLKMSAQAHMDAGAYSNALQTAQAALQLRPKNVNMKEVEVQALYRLGDVQTAIKKAQTYLEEFPNNPVILTALGIIEMESDPPKATSLTQALKVDPDYAPAQYQMGRYLKLRGNYADAKAWFEKYISHHPADAKARGQLGAVHFYLRKYDLARKEYETALALNPKDFNTWYNLGEWYLHQFNNGLSTPPNGGTESTLKTEAFDCYRKTLELFPEHLQANYRVGVLLNGNRQYKEAIRHLQLVLDREPENFRALLQISSAYEQINLAQDALDHLTRAYKIDPGNSIVIHKLKILSQNS